MRRMILLAIASSVISMLVYSETAEQKEPAKTTVSAPAQARNNPIPLTMQSIRKGKQLYARYCTLCHGADGKGDTQMREFLKTAPANFTDQQWVYGDGDAQLFDVISNGRLDRDMEAFAEKMSEERIWHVINYLRFLNGQTP